MNGKYVPSWEGGEAGPGKEHWVERMSWPGGKSLPRRITMAAPKRNKLTMPQLAEALVKDVDECCSLFTGWLSLDVFAETCSLTNPMMPFPGVPLQYWCDAQPVVLRFR